MALIPTILIDPVGSVSAVSLYEDFPDAIEIAMKKLHLGRWDTLSPSQ